MNPLLIAGATQGAESAGTFFGNRSRKRESRRQRQFDLDMWNRQNAYNTPAMQMQRIKDAGLNPALMYGQGNTGNANNAVKASIPEIQNPLSASGVASGVQLSLAKSQQNLNNANAQATLLNAYMKTGGSEESAKGFFQNALENLQRDTELKKQNILNQKTVDSLNQEYLKLERKGYHKGNMAATLLKGVFGIDISTQEGRTTAQWLVGSIMGTKIFEGLTSGVKNILQGLKPSVNVTKSTTIGEQFINK